MMQCNRIFYLKALIMALTMSCLMLLVLALYCLGLGQAIAGNWLAAAGLAFFTAPPALALFSPWFYKLIDLFMYRQVKCEGKAHFELEPHLFANSNSGTFVL